MADDVVRDLDDQSLLDRLTEARSREIAAAEAMVPAGEGESQS